jgi:hypothetical protein
MLGIEQLHTTIIFELSPIIDRSVQLCARYIRLLRPVVYNTRVSLTVGTSIRCALTTQA